MFKRLYFVLIFFVFLSAKGQELNAKVNVVYAQIGTQVDKKVFQTLQTSLVNFLNKRKWTNDVFEVNERVECSFLLNLQSIVEPNVYKGSLTIQAARPIHGTNYLSPLINFIDNEITFRYVEFQPIEFNENRVSGTEPLAANLSALFAYYVNIILGMDFDSFSPRGGDPYFQKASLIANTSPEGRNISGWKPFDGQRNRYWLSENLQNSRYALLHDAIYTYYRQGMDNMIPREQDAREQVLNSLSMLNTISAETPNLMFMPFFFQGKTDEIIRIFKKGNIQDKARVIDLCSRIDISNASRYREELK
ncbi:MAG: DUF4835 family protein [Chitinophagia bacterium]|jgi:hypothetical protein